MANNNGGEEPKLRAQILVSFSVDGMISIQATSNDLIMNLGMLEAAKATVTAQTQKKQSSGIVGAHSVDPMLLKRPPR